ncbi:MAG: hypothetical protein AAF288_13145 [Planctomycetota bacterium]
MNPPSDPFVTFVQIAVLLGVIYLLVGAGFALWFIFKGGARLDPAVKTGTWGFRILVFPGTTALWPVMLLKTLRAESPGSTSEGDPA